MKIIPVKTRPVLPPQDDLKAVLDESLSGLRERDIVMLSSKVVAIDQGRCVKESEADRETLTRDESAHVIEIDQPPYRFLLAIKHGAIFAYAGIDDSNSGEYYILSPQKPFAAAEEIGRHLKKTHDLKELGIIVTDSHLTPLRRGVTGTSIGFWGFGGLRDYRGQPDVFGRPLKHTQVNVPDSLAAVSSLVMGEGNEQTPVAVVSGAEDIEFSDRSLEASVIEIPLDDDLFAPILRPFR